MQTRLIIDLERARAILKNALHCVITELKLPGYLIEGILLDLLNDVRAQKVQELAAECVEALKQIPTPPTPDPQKAETIRREEGEKLNE